LGSLTAGLKACSTPWLLGRKIEGLFYKVASAVVEDEGLLHPVASGAVED
jgi:hypothetical protein